MKVLLAHIGLDFLIYRAETPIPDSTRTPRIPGSSRTWLPIGANWRALENITVGIGYSHIFVQDGDVDLSATDPGNVFRGVRPIPPPAGFKPARKR